MLGELATAHAVRPLDVEPLSREGGRAARRSRTASTPDELYRLTAGNPFFVTEVLAAGGTTDPRRPCATPCSRASRGLSAAGDRGARGVAIVPPRRRAWLLDALCGEAADRLDECLAVRHAPSDDGGVAFRHELARTAVEESLVPVRGASRSTAPSCWRSSSRPTARPISHASRTTPRRAADAEAVLAFAPAAAEEATGLGAHREAAAHYARALRFSADLPTEQCAALLERRSDALYLADDQVAAIAELERAIEHHRSAGATDREAAARGRLVSYLTCRGLLTEADDAAARSLEVLEGMPESVLLADATTAMTLVCAYHGDDEGVIRWAERTMALAVRVGDTEKRIDAAIMLGTVELFRSGDSHLLEEALGEARRRRLPQLMALAMNNLALGWAVRGSNEQAERWIERGLAHCEGLELDLWRLALLSMRVRRELERGAWTDATSTGDLIVSEIRDSPEPRLQALLVLALVRTRRGDPDTGPLLAEAATIAAASSDPGWHASLACVQAEVAWLERRPEASLS